MNQDEANKLVIEQIAKTAHEVNRAYCNSIGDKSQPSWDNAPDWQKDSARMGVKYHFETPGATPADSHQAWLDHKTAEGWKYGPVKDEGKKEHHCFMPYDELPEEQKRKDSLFKAVVDSFK